MIKLILKAKNKKFQLQFQNGEDILIVLDNFLKKNKMKFTDVKDLSLNFSSEVGLISQRIAKVILLALKIAGSHSNFLPKKLAKSRKR